LAQVPFAALHEAAHHLLQQLERFLVTLGGRLAEKTVRLLKAPILECLLCLPECQPREAEHEFRLPSDFKRAIRRGIAE